MAEETQPSTDTNKQTDNDNVSLELQVSTENDNNNENKDDNVLSNSASPVARDKENNNNNNNNDDNNKKREIHYRGCCRPGQWVLLHKIMLLFCLISLLLFIILYFTLNHDNNELILLCYGIPFIYFFIAIFLLRSGIVGEEQLFAIIWPFLLIALSIALAGILVLCTLMGLLSGGRGAPGGNCKCNCKCDCKKSPNNSNNNDDNDDNDNNYSNNCNCCSFFDTPIITDYDMKKDYLGDYESTQDCYCKVCCAQRR